MAIYGGGVGGVLESESLKVTWGVRDNVRVHGQEMTHGSRYLQRPWHSAAAPLITRLTSDQLILPETRPTPF